MNYNYINSISLFLHSPTEAPAEFLKPLSDQKVTEKETAIFECEVTKPNLKPTWKKAGQVIKAGKRYDMTSIGQKHMLTVRDTEMDDQADYTIEVEEGVESTAKLTVIGVLCLDRRNIWKLWYMKKVNNEVFEVASSTCFSYFSFKNTINYLKSQWPETE